MTVNYTGGDAVNFPKTSVALGTFDGLHVSHMKIINKAIEYGAQHNIPCGVMLFDSIPANRVLCKNIPHLMKPEDRNKILSGLDFIYTQSFDEKFSDKTPEEFVTYLKTVLHAVFVSVGFNYRFGKGASGDANMLKALCGREGIAVSIADRTELMGDVVSSTRIRELISRGNVKLASSLLGRYYFMTGKVTKGFRNGHKMGTPTANLEYDNSVVLPKNGVYAGICTVGEKSYKSVINVGKNPTFDGKRVTVECHIPGFNGDIYNREIQLDFVEYIRDEIKFASVEQLKEQIAIDIETALNCLKGVNV